MKSADLKSRGNYLKACTALTCLLLSVSAGAEEAGAVREDASETVRADTQEEIREEVHEDGMHEDNTEATHEDSHEDVEVRGDVFEIITSDWQAEIPEWGIQAVYDGFCRDREIQSVIDYYLIHNRAKRIYIRDIPRILKGVNVTSYVSKSYDMSSRSFPLVDWLYNSITWRGEPMKFYYRIGNSSEAAPIYNISPGRKEKPTGRLVMNLAVGDYYNLLGTGNSYFNIPDCKAEDVNFCTERLRAFNPFRKIMMITREPDGSCVSTLFNAERVDAEYVENNGIYRNEIRFHAPHGNFRFRIADRDWVNEAQKVSGYFTYALNTLTVDGVKYKMIPGGAPWNKSTWYLKGDGIYHEKWLYMYPVGDTDAVYAKAQPDGIKKASKVVITIFDHGTFSSEESTKRFVLYPKKSGSREALPEKGSGR